jgi:ubiquinone/menaquinone biosynthesis C-methylase UbiE
MTFTPALGRLAPVRFYDTVVALTRERRWRTLTALHAAPRPGDLIVDVGCGTGSLALMLARAEPRARVVGVDPDPEVLALARRKGGGAVLPPAAALRASALVPSPGPVPPVVDFRAGSGSDLVAMFGPASADTVVSSLVLHQCPMPVKRAVLASAFGVLRPGGRLVITDYGRQRTALMRLAFRTVQLADGREDTRPNADGVLPELLRAAGFHGVRETEVLPTVTGSISIYVARRE